MALHVERIGRAAAVRHGPPQHVEHVVVDEHAVPDDAVQGNLKATADFRGVYAALIEQWLGADAAQVIPNAARFQRPQLLR